jgi:hypothetical protein
LPTVSCDGETCDAAAKLTGADKWDNKDLDKWGPPDTPLCFTGGPAHACTVRCCGELQWRPGEHGK